MADKDLDSILAAASQAMASLDVDKEKPKASSSSKLLGSIDALLGDTKVLLSAAKSKCIEGPKGCSDRGQVFRIQRCETHYRRYELNKNKERAGKAVECKDGYVRTYTPEGKFVLLARYTMEQKLERPLLREETVAHLDGNKLNCDPANLVLRHKPTGTITCPHCSQPFTID